MSFFGSFTDKTKKRKDIYADQYQKLAGITSLDQLKGDRAKLAGVTPEWAQADEAAGKRWRGYTIEEQLRAYDARLTELQGEAGGGGPSLGGTEPPNGLADLQSAYDTAAGSGLRTRKRAAAGSTRTLVTTPNAATPTLKRRTLLGA